MAARNLTLSKFEASGTHERDDYTRRKIIILKLSWRVAKLSYQNSLKDRELC